jgi:hypothetical protein
MNILLQYSGTGKILQSSTFEDGANLGESLSESRYSVTDLTTNLVVNDTNGVGYLVSLSDDSSSSNYLIIDLSSSNVFTWITNNHPSATISLFQKTSYTLHI